MHLVTMHPMEWPRAMEQHLNVIFDIKKVHHIVGEAK